MDIYNLDILLPEEHEHIFNLICQYNEAKQNKNYKLADTIRHYLYRTNTTNGFVNNELTWYPIFETNKHRLYRAYNRCLKYKICLPSFNRDNKGYIISDYQKCSIEILKEYLK